jgi:hypothetical protein
MSIKKKSLFDATAAKRKEAGSSPEKPVDKPVAPGRLIAGKRLAMAKLTTAKLSTAKLQTLKRLS